jgi:antitoxin ParD1/3/4
LGEIFISKQTYRTLSVIEMRIITVKIPESYLEGLEELVNTGRYTSRSEAIRAAIRDLLRRELWDINNNEKNFKDEEYKDTSNERGKFVKIML